MLANALRSVNECVSITDLEDKLLFVNESFVKTYGYSEEELIGKDMLIVRSPNNPPEVVSEILPATLRGGWNGELWNKRKDGSEFPIYLSTTVINDKNGKPLGLIGVAKDITERRRAEQEIISQKNRFAQLFENSPIAIALLDDQDKIILINESFSALFGYFLEEIRGQSLNDLIVPPELKEEAKSYSDQIREGNQINKESYRKKKDGTLVYVQIVGVPVAVNDKTVGIYGMYVDLTQRKDAEDKMKSAKELAEQSDKLKTEFLAQMSHEIRTPINVITSNVSFIKDELSDKIDLENQDCFKSIEFASKRIIRTIDLILNVSELQTGVYKPLLGKIDIDTQVLKKLYNEYQQMAKQKGIDLIYKCEVKESEIISDEYCVTQIFANLIDNAVKYTKKGNVEILLTKNKDGNIVVEVKDTGIGISKEFLPHLFEPFVQEEQGYTRSFEGNGLGLALVKRYCDINNAVIEVESEKNVGSTFKVIFSGE
jgi:PAS domain S-box-containing protein